MGDMVYYDRVKEAADAIRARVADVPDIAVVLGSGLGDFADTLTGPVSMPYEQLPHWPAANSASADSFIACKRSFSPRQCSSRAFCN